jgi:putative membrane protein
MNVLLAFGPGDGWRHMDGWGWGIGGLLVALVLLLLVAGAVVALVLLLTRSGRGSGPSAGPGTAQQILAERYARGEISTEEYRDRLRELG